MQPGYPGPTRVYHIAAAMAQELTHLAGTNISGLFQAISLPAGYREQPIFSSNTDSMHHRMALGRKWRRPHARCVKKGTVPGHGPVRGQVEFAAQWKEANVWGNTVEPAAASVASHPPEKMEEFPPLTELVDKTILAELS